MDWLDMAMAFCAGLWVISWIDSRSAAMICREHCIKYEEATGFQSTGDDKEDLQNASDRLVLAIRYGEAVNQYGRIANRFLILSIAMSVTSAVWSISKVAS